MESFVTLRNFVSGNFVTLENCSTGKLRHCGKIVSMESFVTLGKYVTGMFCHFWGIL